MWALLQVVFNIFMGLGIFVILMRMNRAPKDDPRLSRGLQLLQSKIAVLEDLSDRTEVQVNQLTAILEQKAREVQAMVQLAEQHVMELRVSMERSLEVAKIFQDKIPHHEIIERQNTIKYVQAARLAHQGLSAEEISAKVDLPKGEIEFIAKVNREQLMFNEEQLPWWVKQEDIEAQNRAAAEASASAASDVNAAFHNSESSQASMSGASEMGGMGVAAKLESYEQSVEERASRLRLEMELAERQRLVENLSRLQFEMQNLDFQLAKDSSVRDLSQAFEVPQVPTESLQKLGEEFRKACEAAAANRTQSSTLLPLEQVTAFIPQALAPVMNFASEQLMSTGFDAQSAVSGVKMDRAGIVEASPAVSSSPEVQDLASNGASQAPAPAAPAPKILNARGSSNQAPVIRKVEFPRISDREV